ncbi:MAG TPA: hypothetical protein VG796_01155 [Verrucomicrobiales bacterium]|jgi:hypothetical protein|nr:hypothetical protein [Verrucomicrobiales bacterium]
MRLLDKLERRFGRYAIRGLIGYIIFFQCIVFAVLFVNEAFVSQLLLRPFVKMDGEWWRLLSFMLVPDARSPLVFIFSAYIALICMYTIEASFGTFRLNLFVLAFILCQWLMAALAGTAAGEAVADATGALLTPDLYPANVYYSFSISKWFFMNLFFVFAVLDPHRVFMLFGIVPLKVWVLALLDAGIIILDIIGFPPLWLAAVLSLAPFLSFGIPLYLRHLRHRTRVGSRRTRFKANSLTVTDGFHRCSVCGRTDASDPDLDFRITEEGVEYCADHLPKS